MSVAVVTPSLNKSFKFQSDWPYNNSQVYLLNSVLEDLKEDEDRTFKSIDDGFVFTSKVNYPNNKSLVKQNVYMNKDSKITRVEVVNKNDDVLISMDYENIEYDKKFDDDYFELNSIIKNNDNQNIGKKDSDDSSKDINTDDNTINDDSVNNSNKSANENTNNSNINVNTNENTNNSTSGNGVKPTLSIKDVIYPMYLPENTYLTSQERVATEDGERLILTFSGDNSFVLVEETIADSASNLIIPVSGEFDFLSDVIGVIGTNSVMWQSNGIEYYITSNTIETAELVDIARSISVLPVSK